MLSRNRFLIVIAMGLFSSTQSYGQEDLVFEDFESKNYGQWEKTGDAFGDGPALGTLPNQMHVDGYLGKGLVNSFFNGDSSVGTLTSRPFRIERNYISFLIGGGRDSERLAIQLLVGDQIVRSATGGNSSAGGSERLGIDGWDVSELLHQSARIKIVDNATGGWGHINVDQIVQTNKKPDNLLSRVAIDLVAQKRYIHFPIKNGAPKRDVTLFVDGKVYVKNEIELATSDVDWWAPMQIDSLVGKKLRIEIDRFPVDSASLKRIEQSDAPIGMEDLYRESKRGQIHFSPKRGWNNDPNGLVFFRGEYHLFFQHNPYGWNWGNMHWGHAVSKDLVHWRELKDELWPDQYGPMFSGSAVVDWNNTTGLGRDGSVPLVLIYTAAGNPTVQCIAYSLDGYHFTKFEGNPVLPEITGGNRDPKVFWSDIAKKWIMALYVEKPAGQHTVHLFSSKDLKQWDLESQVIGDPAGKRYLFECPDMFPLPIDGNPANSKWVILGADCQYGIGSFDGHRFETEISRLPGLKGRGVYAAQTFSDIPKEDGRRILVGWFQTETAGMPFNQSMTIPISLGLISTQDGPILSFTPVKELESLRGSHFKIRDVVLKEGAQNALEGQKMDAFELRCVLKPEKECKMEFNLRGMMIYYDANEQILTVDGQQVAVKLIDGKLDLTIYGDRIGFEVFAQNGTCYIPIPYKVLPNEETLFFLSSKKNVVIESLDLYSLNSIWE